MMTKGEVDRAVRNAQHRMDEWNEVTGFLDNIGSCRGELESLFEDAVHIGIRAALHMPYVGIEDDELTKGYIASASTKEEKGE